MSSTFHVGFGDINISYIRVYPNGTSGSYETYNYSDYPNGFYYVQPTPTTGTSIPVAFRAYTTGGSTGSYWLWYNISGNNNGTDSTYTSNGYQDGKNYVLIAHKSGITGSLSFVTACDNAYKPYMMQFSNSSLDFYFSQSNVYSGNTLLTTRYSDSTEFTIYCLRYYTAFVGGSMAGRNLTDSRNVTISGTTDSGYYNYKDYVIMCHGSSQSQNVTITASSGAGTNSALVNGSSSATVAMGTNVSLTCNVNSSSTTDTETDYYVERTTTSYTFNKWTVGQAEYYTQTATHSATETATAISYATSSSSSTYAWQMKFANGGGQGTMTPLTSSFGTLMDYKSLTVPACTLSPPSQDYRFAYWTDGTNNYAVGTVLSRQLTITLTAVWLYELPYYYWTNDDSTYIQAGQPSTNISASRWNTVLKPLISECETRQGKSHATIPDVNQGDNISYSDYNSVRNALYSLNGWTTIPDASAYGDSFSSAKFRGLTTTLNQIIDYVN